MPLFPPSRQLRKNVSPVQLDSSPSGSECVNSVITNSMPNSNDARFVSAREAVRAHLPPITSLSNEQCARIIKRYSAAIGPNFVVWMAAAIVACRSVEGRFAASENVYIEVKDNHPGMLRDFAKRSQAEPDPADYTFVAPHVDRIQAEISKMSGLYLITLMGVLESTSAEFIPWLAEASRKLGNTDFHYTDVHGDADVEHADQFRWALEKEAALHTDPNATINKAMKMGTDFLVAALDPS